MIKVSVHIKQAIRAAAEALGSVTEIERRSAISHSTFSRYLSGQTPQMNEVTWKQLWPVIAPYVPVDLRQSLQKDGLPLDFSTAAQAARNTPETADTARHEVKVPSDTAAMLKVPVIGFAAAATANPAIMPIAEFANEYADDYQAFPLAQPGDFCLVVSGDSMLPLYPEGTRLLCRSCRPQHGQRVVAVLGSGEVVFKVFAEKDDKFCLFSINDDGADFVFSKTDYGAVRAIYSIIESIRDEQAIDKAMRSSGIRHRWEEKLKSI